ncbi:FAD-binding protein [Streptomyces sp. NPDC005811]|uniref:FAD-binding protein n=1 Tax=Streptomyces sp. NPDC005811 TaxID=3154565 RepID=UPI0033C5F8B2
MTNWDDSVDFIVVGSGGGAFVGALAARHAGARVLMLEKRDLVGGSTAMSGGIVWIPANPVMAAAGIPDSVSDGMTYFEHVVGDVGPSSSIERRRAFLDHGSKMVTFLQGRGLRFEHCMNNSDYYPEYPGGRAAGRAFEPKPFDGRKLGDWLPKLQLGLAATLQLVVKTNEMRYLSSYNRSLRCFGIGARVATRTIAARVSGRRMLTNGTALIGRMLHVALRGGVEIRTGTAVRGLVTENGRVVGVRAVRDGQEILVEARKGVLLAAGGFAHNAEMRRKYSGDQPNEGQWTMANPGDEGEPLLAAMEIGAKTDLMDEAWWIPMCADPLLAESALNMARQRPGSIFVDASGQRFVNETASKMAVGKAMYERDPVNRAIPCWQVFDDAFRKRYAVDKGLPGRIPPQWLESGAIKRAATLEELARLCDIDPAGLASTVTRFNEHARNGLDPEFHRGESALDRAYGDPGYKPNPAIGPLDRGPFYAVQVVPSDIGTCGGLVTDPNGQVLNQDDQPIPGLYASGNNTATVMGRRYLGPGASIADSMVFGYAAGLHATREQTA